MAKNRTTEKIKDMRIILSLILMFSGSCKKRKKKDLGIKIINLLKLKDIKRPFLQQLHFLPDPI